MWRIALLLAATLCIGLPALGREKMSLDLKESIRIALERSKSLAAAREKVMEAEARIGQARAAFLPQISNRSTYTRLDVAPYISMAKFPFPMPSGVPPRIQIGRKELYNITTSLQQPIFTGFKILSGYKISKYRAEAEMFNYEKAKEDLILDVQEAYYRVLKAQEFLKVSEQAVEQMEAHLHDLENMYKLGMIAENDLLKAKVQLSQVKLTRIQAVNAVRMAKTAFCSVIGVPLGTEVELKPELKYDPPPPIDLEDAIATALKERPEVKAMEYTLKALEKSVSVTKAQWLPNLMLIGNYNYKKPDRENENKWYRSWDVTLAIQMNIWDWGSVYYQTAQAKHRLRQMRKAYEQLKDGITLEVTQAYLSLKEAQERVSASEENLAQAEENYRVTEEKFRQGMATNTDVLDANAMLTRAKVEHIQALADYNLAIAKLERVMGTSGGTR